MDTSVSSLRKTADSFGKWQFFPQFLWFLQIVTLLHAYSATLTDQLVLVVFTDC